MLERLALVAGRASVGKPGREPGRARAAGIAAFGVLARRLEEPGLGLLELIHVVVVVREKCACRLHVADARVPQLEVDTIGLSLGLELGDLLLIVG